MTTVLDPASVPQDAPTDDGHIEDVPVIDDPENDVASLADLGGAAETPPSTDTGAAGDSVVASPACDKPRKKRVSKYTTISKATFTDSLELQGDVYTAKLDTPCHILSPTVTLQSGLVDDDGEYLQYATLKLKRTHAQVFQQVEETLLQTAKRNKMAWFGNDTISDDFLEKSLKRFVDLDAKTLTVKIDEGLGGKTDVQAGTKIKCVLSAPHAIFTRTQFGVPFTLELVKSIEKNENSYLFDPEEDEAYNAVTGADLMTHLISSEDIADEIS